MLEQLVQIKNLSEIKVVELCRLSGVSRSTFYTHFSDIYSVPQVIWDDMMEPSLYKIGYNLTWDEGHRCMFQNLLKHKTLFTRICWENDHNSIPEYGYRGVYSAIKNNIKHRIDYEWTHDELMELDYTTRALASLATKWGCDGMVLPVETAVKILNEHVPPFFKKLCDI